MKAIITGGAGFIGSHLADRLVKDGHEAVVIDDLSGGVKGNVHDKATLIVKDIRSDISAEVAGADAVFHFAADPDVRGSAGSPANGFSRNVAGTLSVLESCRRADIRRIVFASTSTVYGEAAIPTPETHPCSPVSNYGASKLACEGYLSSYSSSYGMKCTSLRYANIYGPRSRHGVMHDFYLKMRADPSKLEILGDGNQSKSYLHVSDCVDATVLAWENQSPGYDVFNVGSTGRASVIGIARLMCRSLGIAPAFSFSGGVKGWAGDIPNMLPDVSKIGRLGWKQRIGLEDGIISYLSWLGDGF